METAKKKLLRKQILDLKDLPTINANVMLVLKYLREEDNINKAIGTINRDQVLVAQILKLINSSMYGLRQEVVKIDHAINLLGIQTIKELLYTISIMNDIAGKDETLWLHSYSTFYLMSEMVKANSELGLSGSLPLTMLMHDIGQLVLDKFNPNTHRMAMLQSSDQRVPLPESEELLMGVEHGEVGGWLMSLWEMGDETIIPIAYHHSKEIPETFALETAMVQIVDWIDWQIRGVPTPGPNQALIEQVGIVSFDKNYWYEKHARVIDALDTSNPAIKKKKTEKKAPVILAEGDGFVDVPRERGERKLVPHEHQSKGTSGGESQPDAHPKAEPSTTSSATTNTNSPRAAAPIPQEKPLETRRPAVEGAAQSANKFQNQSPKKKEEKTSQVERHQGPMKKPSSDQEETGFIAEIFAFLKKLFGIK